MNYSHCSSLPTFLVVSFHTFLEGKPRKTLHLLPTFPMYRLTKARALSAKCLYLLSALAWNAKNIISYRGRMGTKTRPTCSVQEKRPRFWKTAAFERPPRGQILREIQAFKKIQDVLASVKFLNGCFLFKWLARWTDQTRTMWSQCGLS